MGHYISGIVAELDLVREFASSVSLHAPAVLTDGLGFLPLSADHLDFLFPVQGGFDDAMTYLSDSLKVALSELSANGLVAFVETEYHGGQGVQSAVVYDQGHCILGPITNDSGAISGAMKLLGVTVDPGLHDEFESVGLCRHRNNEDWIDETMQS